MRIYEIIFESDISANVGKQTFPVREQFGGGKITITVYPSQSMVTSEFSDPSGKMLIKHETKNNQHKLYYEDNPNVESFHNGTSAAVVKGIFSKGVTDIMMNNYNARTQERNSNDNETLSIIRKMGKKPMNENINSPAESQLKGWSDAYDWAMSNLGRTITQWPPGWEVTESLEEDTTVNMSPYKDSIKNAETPKSKQAKNKVNDLFRK